MLKIRGTPVFSRSLTFEEKTGKLYIPDFAIRDRERNLLIAGTKEWFHPLFCFSWPIKTEPGYKNWFAGGKLSKTLIKKKVQKLAEEAAEVAGVEIVDLELLGQIGRLILRVTIDRDGGIGVDDCERMSRQLEALLDIEDPIPGGYTLEVSSPGLDRPLRSLKDYERFQGRLARVVTFEAVQKTNVIIGRIKEVKKDTVVLQTERGDLDIPYSNIKKGNLEVEMP